MSVSRRVRRESSYIYYKHHTFAFDFDLRTTPTSDKNTIFEQWLRLAYDNAADVDDILHQAELGGT